MRTTSVVAGAYLVILVMAAVVAPVVTQNPNAIDLTSPLQAPSGDHLFGTDELGRDVFARVVHGTRVSLVVAFAATALAVVAGGALGALAGYFEGLTDVVVSRIAEVFLSFPTLLAALFIVSITGPGVWTVVAAIALTTWANDARLMRGEVLRVKEEEFVGAAKAIGASPLRILARHILPNAVAPLFVSAAFGVSGAILTESSLSFLGLGVPLPLASWGNVLSSADDFIAHAWWLALYPGLAIVLTVLACVELGEAVRRRLAGRR